MGRRNSLKLLVFILSFLILNSHAFGKEKILLREDLVKAGSRVSRVKRLAMKAASKYEVPFEDVFWPILDVESGRIHSRGGKTTESPAGALGVGQLMPRTAEGLGVDPHDLRQNLDGAAKYLKKLHKRLGSWQWTVMGYSKGGGGANKIRRTQGEDSYKDQEYYQRVIKHGGFQFKPTASARPPEVTPARPGRYGADPAATKPPVSTFGADTGQSLRDIPTPKTTPHPGRKKLTRVLEGTSTLSPKDVGIQTKPTPLKSQKFIRNN